MVVIQILYRVVHTFMIDLSKIVGFNWDASHSQKEPRLHALGKTDEGRALHITFTLRQSGQLVRVISARDMHRKERAIYDQAD